VLCTDRLVVSPTTLLPTEWNLPFPPPPLVANCQTFCRYMIPPSVLPLVVVLQILLFPFTLLVGHSPTFDNQCYGHLSLSFC